ncbi:hypothetical protein GDO78_021168 [Eleutherodactylus coqui]|uniref:Uncharacterized protein n=1 Tax=Eleutherodactylus coqui TaxID=57060 RepID=A0A8J6B2Z6_ELECQ|nr:hypothetical protein GDO78_021168 [Eleutherodactylus coqui]
MARHRTRFMVVSKSGGCNRWLNLTREHSIEAVVPRLWCSYVSYTIYISQGNVSMLYEGITQGARVGFHSIKPLMCSGQH